MMYVLENPSKVTNGEPQVRRTDTAQVIVYHHHNRSEEYRLYKVAAKIVETSHSVSLKQTGRYASAYLRESEFRGSERRFARVLHVER